jgi:hypothetical protein
MEGELSVRSRIGRRSEQLAAEERSRRLARLVGPALIAISASEAVNLDVVREQYRFDSYLDGSVVFVAGLSLVHGHNRWSSGWPVVLTLTGWAAMLGGLVRMFAPRAEPGQAVLVRRDRGSVRGRRLPDRQGLRAGIARGVGRGPSRPARRRRRGPVGRRGATSRSWSGPMPTLTRASRLTAAVPGRRPACSSHDRITGARSRVVIPISVATRRCLRRPSTTLPPAARTL